MFYLARPAHRSMTTVASAAQVAVRPDAARLLLRNFPERCPARVRDFRPSALAAVEVGEPVDFLAHRQFPAPQLLAALRPADPSLARTAEVA
jgi:hypothetical protein